jgi:signal transduction histidine kinase
MLKRVVLTVLVAAFFALTAIWSAQQYKLGFQPQQIAKQIEKNLLHELSLLNQEATILRKASPQDKHWAEAKYAFQLFDSARLIAWTSRGYAPETAALISRDSISLFQSNRGDYLVRKWELANHKILLGVLPLIERYKVNNQYLRTTWNSVVFPIENIQVLKSDGAVGLPIKNFFAISDEFVLDSLPFDWCSFLLAVVSFFMLLLALALTIQWLRRIGWYDVSFLVLLIVLLLFRLVMIRFNFPAVLGYSTLFDPQKFASSWLNVSLGDFLLNALVVAGCSIYLFTIYTRLKLFDRLLQSSHLIKVLASIFLLTLALFAFLFPFLFYEIIFHNSSIRLDISQSIFFDELRVIAFACVILGFVSSFIFCHVAVTYAKHLINQVYFLAALTASVILFSGYAWLSNHDYTLPLVIAIGYILVLFATNLSSSLSKIGFVGFSYFLFAACSYGLLGAMSVRYFSQEATYKAQLRFANNSLINHDILGEFILFDAGKKIAEDIFIQSRFANPFLPKSGIRERVQQLYINPYFDRYEVNIYLYDVAGEAITDDVQSDLVGSIQRVQKVATKTDYEGVYWLNEPKTKSIKRYINIISINNSNPLGYVLIDLSLKRITPRSVYPELLLDNRFAQFLNTEDFSYGFFLRGQLITSNGDFNYRHYNTAKILSNPLLFAQGVTVDGYNHIAVDNEGSEVVVVSAKVYEWYHVLANFSFWFVAGLIIVFCWILVLALMSFYRSYKLSYSTRIQMYIYAAFILPLLALAIATLTITNNSYHRERNDNAADKSEVIAETIAQTIELADSSQSIQGISAQLASLAKSSQTDITLFNAQGELLASSQPLIFENQLQSKHLNREAYYRLSTLHENYVVRSEQIGALQYSSTYRAVRAPLTGSLLGVVNFPFFQSAKTTEQLQALVFSNILVVFVVVFLLFNILSTYAVNWLTFPLKFITRSLSATTLTGENKPLHWKSNDEIGMMVAEYNRMLQNLESSKAELARTQKESAWREMAQQVAHEIKNPLTPMKLMLQRMELNAAFETDEKKQALKTMLQQVEILNGIATSFSSFAKMPVPILTKTNLVQSLSKAVALYAHGTYGNVVFNTEYSEVLVMGDEQLLTRIFSNLIINGLQAHASESEATVEVTLEIDKSTATISFADNGSGIPEGYEDKIFIPSFSTKKTGSGLGLAIAKQGIEHMNGKIGFEANENVGCRFYIQLPVITFLLSSPSNSSLPY